jgi:hypothetical protein
MEDFQTLGARRIEAVRTFTPEAIARLSWSRKQVREEQVRGLRRVRCGTKESCRIRRNPKGSHRQR